MKMIVGLGNPGREYAATRHNVGRMVVDALADRHRAEIAQRKFKSLVGEMRSGGEKIILLKPSTFMNLSGEAIAAALGFFRLEPQEMLVVCDDMDLPLGKLRLRASGGTGGHKGLASIEAALGARDYPRLRVGIGRTEDADAVGYVLGKFAGSEKEEVQRAIERAADAVETWLREGMEKAMNVFNPDDKRRQDK
jgi:PTH1 family peptidyl-tRNA hydrolase